MGYVNIHGQPLNDLDARVSREQERRRRLGIFPEPRRQTVKNGYAAPPGTGPADETCGTCAHRLPCSNQGGTKRYSKCELERARWTHGEGTDILARSPACVRWAAIASASPTASPDQAAPTGPDR